MDYSDFWAKRKERGPKHCQWCEHWGGPVDQKDPDEPIWCLRSQYVRSQPENGCAFWSKAAGVGFEPTIVRIKT